MNRCRERGRDRNLDDVGRGLHCWSHEGHERQHQHAATDEEQAARNGEGAEPSVDDELPPQAKHGVQPSTTGAPFFVVDR